MRSVLSLDSAIRNTVLRGIVFAENNRDCSFHVQEDGHFDSITGPGVLLRLYSMRNFIQTRNAEHMFNLFEKYLLIKTYYSGYITHSSVNLTFCISCIGPLSEKDICSS